MEHELYKLTILLVDDNKELLQMILTAQHSSQPQYELFRQKRFCNIIISSQAQSLQPVLSQSTVFVRQYGMMMPTAMKIL